MEFEVFNHLVLAFLLGLLVGIQRERRKVRLGGMRTFPLIAVFGNVCALLAQEYGNLALVGGFLSLAFVCVVPHLTHLILYSIHPTAEPTTDESGNDQKERDYGITTLMAALLLFGVGALLTIEKYVPLAVIIGGSLAILLQFKIELHNILDRLRESDMRAIMQFVLISCVILPFLPNENFGPYNAFNPFEAWLMVVLIVGMSLGGYIVYMFLGQNAGILLGGFLGGAISSTATTISYSKQVQSAPSTRVASSVVIMIASTVVFVRVLVLIAVVCPPLLYSCIGPICVLMLCAMIPALLLWFGIQKAAPPAMPEQKNPTQLKSAITFGVMYSVVKLALAAAKDSLGHTGLYAVAGISGLTDMDAITLSTARLVQNELTQGHELSAAMLGDSWRMILIAAVASIFFKTLLVGAIADRKFFGVMLRLFAIPFIGGVLIVMLWPW